MSSPASPVNLREAAATLAAASDGDRRAALAEVERIRREDGCTPTDLGRYLDAGRAQRVAAIAKALSDPARVALVDVLRQHGHEVCQCDLQPLLDVSQPTLSHHLAKLVDAGLVRVERRSKWAYYSIDPGAQETITAWLAWDHIRP